MLIVLILLIVSILMMAESAFYDKSEPFSIYERNPDPVYGGTPQDTSVSIVDSGDSSSGTSKKPQEPVVLTIRNYPDPAFMSVSEKIQYMSNYRDDFTLLDYRDWLLLFKNDQARLPYIHLRNLQKLERGLAIEVPRKLDMNMDVTGLTKQPYVFAEPADYFKSKNIGVKYLRQDGRNLLKREKMLLERLQKPQVLPRGNDLTRLNSEQGGFLPSNVSEYRDTMVPDVLLWKGGLDTTAKRSKFLNQKVDAYELNYFVRPAAYTGDVERTLGRKYQNAQEDAFLRTNEHQEDYHQRAETDNFARPVEPSKSSYV